MAPGVATYSGSESINTCVAASHAITTRSKSMRRTCASIRASSRGTLPASYPARSIARCSSPRVTCFGSNAMYAVCVAKSTLALTIPGTWRRLCSIISAHALHTMPRIESCRCEPAAVAASIAAELASASAAIEAFNNARSRLPACARNNCSAINAQPLQQNARIVAPTGRCTTRKPAKESPH